MTDESEAGPNDRGFTMLELLVATAVFSVLMAIVGGAMLSGFSGVRNIMARTDDQSSARNAGIIAEKLLRYVDLPEGQTASITEAGPTSITFFTYSGTGSKHDVPYRARIYTVTNADGTRSLMTQVSTPRAVSGGWTYPTAPVTKTLLTLPSSATQPLRVTVWVRNPLTVPAAEPRNATPATSGPLVLSTGEVPESVVLEIGDRLEPRSVITQQVRLWNLA